MRIVIQRVKSASVAIGGLTKSSIETGFLVYLGVAHQDNQDDIDWLCGKLAGLRVFNDPRGLMNHNLQDVSGSVLVISQFTLHARTKKGNRPSFTAAAGPDTAIPLYEAFVKCLENKLPGRVHTGEFGADMQVESVNEGPVTICIDSRNRE